MVVLQHATESFSAFDSARDGTDICGRLDELIAEPLMIPLAVVVLDVLMHGVLK